MEEECLTDGILKFSTEGVFASHLPEFLELFQFLVGAYRTQAEDFRACIVGGLCDGTSGTLSPPDLDLNMEWLVNDTELLQLIDIHTLDEGSSGQYRIQVAKYTKLVCECAEYTKVFFQVRSGSEDKFLKIFRPIVNEIQSLGKTDWYDLNQISEIVVSEDSSTFLSANLLRNQLKGLSEVAPVCETEQGLGHILRSCVIKDFSPTGAARTFGLDLQGLISYVLEDKSYSASLGLLEPYQRYVYCFMAFEIVGKQVFYQVSQGYWRRSCQKRCQSLRSTTPLSLSSLTQTFPKT